MKILSQLEIDNAALHKNILGSPLLHGLSKDLQKDLLAMGTFRKWQRNEALFIDGDPVDYVYYLISGTIKEYYSDGFGDEFLRKIFNPGGYISLHSVVRQQQFYTYSCMAVMLSDCFVIKAENFIEILKQESELSLKIAIILSGEYENSCRKKCLCKKVKAVSKVAGYLLSKQNNGMCPNSGYQSNLTCCNRRIDLRPLELSACDVCLVRETFTRALTALQKQNIIRSWRGVVEILDEDALKEICGIESNKSATCSQ